MLREEEKEEGKKKEHVRGTGSSEGEMGCGKLIHWMEEMEMWFIIEEVEVRRGRS